MAVADSSVLVAALSTWHERHAVCWSAVAGARRMGHALVETYSVLTRLPAPHRLAARDAAALIAGLDPRPALVLSAAAAAELPERLAAAGIAGGATYDGLIALTALSEGEELLSLDAAATRTYRALEVPFTLLA